MSLPEPPSSVDNGCSVVHDNTLYVFTPTAFMALPLEEDAEWEELEMGQQVTGGVCVGTGAELFVVGGNGGPAEYNGLQKFIFADKKWETIPTDNPAFRNLQYHGAAYIKNANRIVVAGGNQDGREAPSQNTYYIDLANAMNIMSAAGAPPVISPVVIPWSDDAACILWDKEVRTFASGGWVNNDVTLAEALPPSSKALVLSGDDGSKSLYVFDLAASPNVVHRYAVWGANDQGIQGAVDANAKRDLSMNDWPDYNSTLAPTITRAQGQYSIAQDSNGRVVFVGGNADEPLAFFDMKENSWLDAADVVGEQKILSAESSTATTKTKTSSTKTSSSESSTKTKSVTSDASSTFATSTASASETESLFASETISESSSATGTDAASIAGGSSDGDSGLSSNAILGITLGTILGFLALLVVILLLLRRRKKAQQQQPSPERAQPKNGFASDKKDPMGLGGAPVSPFRGHQSNMSQESFSSMTILMGGAGKNNKTAAPREVRNLADEKEMGFGGASPASPHFRNHVSTMSQDSQSSMAILMGRAGKGNGNNGNSAGVDQTQFKSTIGKPILQESQYPTVQGQDAKGVAFDPNVAEPRARNGPLETQDGLRRSSGWNRYWSGGSALQILGFGGPPKRNTVSSDTDSHYSEQPGFRNPRVTQDSATVPPLNFEFRPEMNRVNSGSPVVSEYSKNIPFRDGVAGKIERPISKTSSGYSSGIPESVNETWDPESKDKQWGTDRATSSIYNPSFYFGQPLSPRVPPPQTPPSGVSTQPQLAMASQSNDMSWLNLGDRARQ
ncbi:hypothetical protein FSPOR_3860 [Fusarium sporotrichioides]|uniref:Pre-mrna splicing factor clf1 n=1 Tax=Fusarium sporotrichioides TaxID=5514 RepID=A0A395SER4_FUSSP|nr:hypothetical protein FSPOR_3860 [Fusarium sporotrichioides]